MRSLTRILPGGHARRRLRASVTLTSGELLLDQLVAPVAEGALGELHDVALVHQGHAAAAVVEGVLDGPADQALGAGDAHGLDADAGIRADLRAHLRVQELDDLRGFGRALLPFDAGVDVLGVLAEDHHVQPLRLLHGRGHAGEVAHRAHADVEVQQLAQGDVQAADAAADRRGERALDGDVELADGVERVLGQPSSNSR